MSAPDTPNVCPTCDDTGLVAPLGGRGSDGPDPCPHCTPAAGSSSPDVAALAERLRDGAGRINPSASVTWMRSDEPMLLGHHLSDAADALEAQAARITELEAALAPFLRLVDPEEGGWRVLDDDVLEIDDSTPLTVREADAIRAQLARHP